MITHLHEVTAVRPPCYYLLRVKRDGPLVPARLQWLDHEPGVPENKLDRGRFSVYPAADIAGAEVDPELLFDRLFSHDDPRPGIAATHWKYPEPISEAMYRWHFERMRWAERNRPDDPVLRPRQRVDPGQIEINFDREHAAIEGRR